MASLGSHPPRVLSPLWVISLFLGMSEVAVTIAVTQADGWIQALLAIFAVVFPTLVAAVFFYILWYDNKILYAPRDFAEGTTVTEYAQAMGRTARRTVNIMVESALRSERERINEQLVKLGATEAQRDEVLPSVNHAPRAKFITVNFSTFAHKTSTMDFPIHETSTVTDLLDTVYFAMPESVETFSYLRTWVLQDDATGQLYDKIGTFYARRHLGTDRDFRLLKDVDIRPGASVTAVPLTGQVGG